MYFIMSKQWAYNLMVYLKFKTVSRWNNEYSVRALQNIFLPLKTPTDFFHFNK